MQKIGSREHKRLRVLIALRVALDKQFKDEATTIHEKHGVLPIEQYLELMPDEYKWARNLLQAEYDVVLARLNMMGDVRE